MFELFGFEWDTVLQGPVFMGRMSRDAAMKFPLHFPPKDILLQKEVQKGGVLPPIALGLYGQDAVAGCLDLVSTCIYLEQHTPLLLDGRKRLAATRTVSTPDLFFSLHVAATLEKLCHRMLTLNSNSGNLLRRLRAFHYDTYSETTLNLFLSFILGLPNTVENCDCRSALQHFPEEDVNFDDSLSLLERLSWEHAWLKSQAYQRALMVALRNKTVYARLKNMPFKEFEAQTKKFDRVAIQLGLTRRRKGIYLSSISFFFQKCLDLSEKETIRQLQLEF